MHIKVNGKLLTGLAFLFAAVGSTVVTALCAGAAIFGDKKHKGEHALEAVFMSVVPSIISFILSVVSLIIQNINISLVLTTAGTIINIMNTVTSIGVFVLCIAAAYNILSGRDSGLGMLPLVKKFQFAVVEEEPVDEQVAAQ